MSVTIRVATTPDDVAAVRRLMSEYIDFLLNHPTGSAHFCIGGIDEELANLAHKYAPPGCLLLAELDDDPVGCVAVRELRPAGVMAEVHQAEGGGLALEIKRLWVQPRARGLGLGVRLMQEALSHCYNQRAVAAYLDTVPAAMPNAARMYQDLGFEQTGRYNSNDLSGVAYFRRRLMSTGVPTEVTELQNPTN